MSETTPEPVPEPAEAPVPEPAPEAPAVPVPGAEHIFRHIEQWFKAHAEPGLEDITGAVAELEHSNKLHAQATAHVSTLASLVLSVVKDVAPSSAALPELETVVADIARIAAELAPVL